MERIKIYTNKESSGSNIIALLSLGFINLGLVYLGWDLIAGLYMVFIIVIIYLYLKSKRILEVRLTEEQITFIYTRNFKKIQETFFLNFVTLKKVRNATFEFSKVYDLEIYIDSRLKFLLKSQIEFADKDLIEIYQKVTEIEKRQ